MLPKKGRRLPVWEGVLSGRDAYTQTIAELLRREHGDSHRAVKQLMRQTHASERAVKHWLSGQHGPDTVFFLRLAVSSPIIRVFLLGLIEKPAANSSADHVDRNSLSAARAAYVAGENTTAVPRRRQWHNDPMDDPDRDTIDDPEPAELNERQRWFLARVEAGDRCSANEIVSVWQVSLKSARRDIAGLKAQRLIQYVGSRRRGRYKRCVRQCR